MIPDHIGWYISGFCDGEGSFNVSLRRKTDYKIGWQVVLSFNVSQRDITMLALIKRYLKCGIIKKRQDGLYSYDVTNPNAITNTIIPFFEKFRFFSASKKYNFRLFEQITKLVADKKHLSPEGFQEIMILREKLNPGRGRTRKYNIADVLIN
jgi:hypothetical protein